MNVSVVLAAYNGQEYIREQIDTIVSQLTNADELIISDDGSTDNTLKIIAEYVKQYNFVKLLKGPQQGYIQNFQFLFSQTKNEIVFISDQDDIWCPNKVKTIKEIFENNPDIWLVSHSAQFCNTDGVLLDSTTTPTHGYVKNLIRSTYWGCCTALRREYLRLILPFPFTKYCYDQWMCLFAEKKHRAIFINDILIYHRLHSSNQTYRRSFIYRVKFRVMLIRYMLSLNKRMHNR